MVQVPLFIFSAETRLPRFTLPHLLRLVLPLKGIAPNYNSQMVPGTFFMNRRKYLEWVLRGIGALVAAVVALPALLFGLSPLFQRREKTLWQPVGRLEDFPVGKVTPTNVEIPQVEENSGVHKKGVYVLRETEVDIFIYSRNCTDLSCPIVWDPGSDWFYCPCHGGIFSRDGEVQVGPPNRPLYQYAYRLQNGILEIDLKSLPAMT
jgi:menaquinol-cytochrome c reductase iron-sulfur subunit